MKHSFLLDENILYHAVRGVDRRDRPDTTSAELLLRIAENCHHICLDQQLLTRYWRHLQRLVDEPAPAFQPLNFILEFLHNSAKAHVDYHEPPDLPDEITVPREDTYVVRAALLTKSVLVTADDELRNSVNNQGELGVRALTPSEALELARDQ